MSERMHPVYTLIPQRSYDAIVGRGDASLPDLLTAIVVDPDEADDVAKQGISVDYSFDEIAYRGGHLVSEALNSVAIWLNGRESRFPVSVGEISRWEPRLGAWILCSLIENLAPFVASSDEANVEDSVDIIRMYIAGKVPERVVEDSVNTTTSKRRSPSAAAITIDVINALKNAMALAFKTSESRGSSVLARHAAYRLEAAEKRIVDLYDPYRKQVLPRAGVATRAILSVPVRHSSYSGSGSIASASASSLAPAAIVGAVLGAGAMYFAKRS